MASIGRELEPEALLVRRVQSGDGGAFDRLIELCTPRVYAIAFRMMGNSEDAQDVTQEAFLRAFQAIRKFREDASFNTWLYRIVVNVCHDELDRRKRRPATMTEMTRDDDASRFLDIPSSEESPEDLYLRRERQHALLGAIEQLPDIYRNVVILHDLEGMQYDEIAAVLHTNIGTVKSRVNRGRNLLREKIFLKRELFSIPASQS